MKVPELASRVRASTDEAHTRLERALCQTQRKCPNADAPGVQRFHKIDEAFSLRAETLALVDVHVFENQLARVGSAPAPLVFFFACAYAFGEGLQLTRVTDADSLGGLEIGRLFRHN